MTFSTEKKKKQEKSCAAPLFYNVKELNARHGLCILSSYFEARHTQRQQKIKHRIKDEETKETAQIHAHKYIYIHACMDILTTQ